MRRRPARCLRAGTSGTAGLIGFTVGGAILRGRSGRMVFATVWILTTLIGAWTLVQLELRSQAEELLAETQRLHSLLEKQAVLNDAAIEGMAAILRICPRSDPEPVRRFARSILERYRHIYVLGSALRIEHPARAAFEGMLRAQGYAGGIRVFDYDGDRQWHPVPAKPDYYPIQLAEPELDSTWDLLGLDLDAVPLFRDALQRALLSEQPAVSGVWEMTIGQRAYGMLRPVCEAIEGPCDGSDSSRIPRHIALLVVFAESMLDCDSFSQGQYSCTVSIEEKSLPGGQTVLASVHAASTASALERLIFPEVSYRMATTRSSQPLALELARQFDLHSVNLIPALLLLSLSALGLLVALRLRRQRERSEGARAAMNRELQQERATLEIRVEERTRRLSEMNDELARENRAREVAEAALQHKGKQLRLLARRLMEAQEQERRSLAQELHDDLGQTLTALRTHAQMIRQQHTSETDVCAKSAATILDLAGGLYDSTHRIMRGLRPRALDELGLAGALQSSIDAAGLTDLGIEVHADLCGDLEMLEDPVAITIYRLLQEALTNVARHSGARNVWIRLERGSPRNDPENIVGGMLRLSIEDDGCGMPEPVLDKDRLGLLGAQERVEALGGEFSVTTGANGGVFLWAQIPVHQEG